MILCDVCDLMCYKTCDQTDAELQDEGFRSTGDIHRIQKIRNSHPQGTCHTTVAAAKKQVIGQLGVSGDNREGLFLGLGKSYLHYNRYDTLPEVFAQIEKITAGQILEVANEVLAPERLFCLIYE